MKNYVLATSCPRKCIDFALSFHKTVTEKAFVGLMKKLYRFRLLNYSNDTKLHPTSKQRYIRIAIQHQRNANTKLQIQSLNAALQ